jgi:dihydrofolate reductase
MSEIIIISGVAKNGVIGNKGKLPWHISEDLKRFKDLTLGSPVVMGRKTYESIVQILGKPLPGRRNIVLSKSMKSDEHGTEFFAHVKDALEEAKNYGSKIFVIGGQKIYEQMLEVADRMEITEVKKEFEGDSFFPKVNWGEWKETCREDKGDFSFVSYERVR